MFLASYAYTHRAELGDSTGDMSNRQIQALAQTVRPEEVVMYSTTECGYCKQAAAWLQQNGFAFTECNMSVDRRCENEFAQYGANGTPFLVIRRGGKEHLMREGFDSDEFLAAIKGA